MPSGSARHCSDDSSLAGKAACFGINGSKVTKCDLPWGPGAHPDPKTPRGGFGAARGEWEGGLLPVPVPEVKGEQLC